MGLGKNYRMPPAMILTYSYHLVHVNTDGQVIEYHHVLEN